MAQSPSTSEQLLATILTHQSFPPISNVFSVLQQYHDELPTADLPFVQLQLLEMLENMSSDQLRKSKLEQAIQKLETMMELIEEESDIVSNKLRWTRQQTAKIEESRGEIESEIDILRSCHKSNAKGEKLRSPGAGKGELQQILEYYQCQQFPKNKTEALMLVNKIQCKIQQFQMSRAAQFQFTS